MRIMLYACSLLIALLLVSPELSAVEAQEDEATDRVKKKKRRRSKSKRRSRRSEPSTESQLDEDPYDSPYDDSGDAAAESQPEPSRPRGAPDEADQPITDASAKGALRRSGRMEFDERLVKGQAAKSGAIYLFKRTPRRLPGLVPMRRSYRRRIVQPILGPRRLKPITAFAEPQTQRAATAEPVRQGTGGATPAASSGNGKPRNGNGGNGAKGNGKKAKRNHKRNTGGDNW